MVVGVVLVVGGMVELVIVVVGVVGELVLGAGMVVVVFGGIWGSSVKCI